MPSRICLKYSISCVAGNQTEVCAFMESLLNIYMQKWPMGSPRLPVCSVYSQRGLGSRVCQARLTCSGC